MGLDHWFQQQLHPETIDQTDLIARLHEYPAMQLAPQDLLFRFPTNGVIRQTIDKKAPEPQSAAVRRIYDNEIFRFDQRQQEKQQKQQLASSPQPASTSMRPSMAGQPTASSGMQTSASDGNMAMSASPSAPSSMAAPASAAYSEQTMSNPAANDNFRKEEGANPVSIALPSTLPS